MEMTSQRSRVSNRTIGPSKVERRITVGLVTVASSTSSCMWSRGIAHPRLTGIRLNRPGTPLPGRAFVSARLWDRRDLAAPELRSRRAETSASESAGSILVLGDSPQWFERASRGNPVAAQAVFFLLRNCRLFGPAIATLDPRQMPRESNEASRASNCQSIPQNFGDDPFYWLEFAARNGDPLSQVVYAQHADTLQQNPLPKTLAAEPRSALKRRPISRRSRTRFR